MLLQPTSERPRNPPATNAAVESSGLAFQRTVDEMPPREVVDEIDAKVDMVKLEAELMREGVIKFADPQKALLKVIAEKRRSLVHQRA